VPIDSFGIAAPRLQRDRNRVGPAIDPAYLTELAWPIGVGFDGCQDGTLGEPDGFTVADTGAEPDHPARCAARARPGSSRRRYRPQFAHWTPSTRAVALHVSPRRRRRPARDGDLSDKPTR